MSPLLLEIRGIVSMLSTVIGECHLLLVALAKHVKGTPYCGTSHKLVGLSPGKWLPEARLSRVRQ